ncbi:MAG: hypothetical protein ABIN91_03705 [Mucilaginibacter sp.]|uniref:PepSY-like domain-containing protein n=1 Tax=Mucilaginibacter sp. TaxID=1882438 RepID=UPI0032648055
MKKIITLISVFTIGFGFFANAQYIGIKDLPASVTEDFSFKYPKLSKVDWEKDGKKFKATFNVETYAHEVVYDQKGNVISQVFAVPVANLPSDVFDGVKKNFPDVQVKEANQIVENGKISYKLNLVDENNGLERILIAPDGRIIKTLITEN